MHFQIIISYDCSRLLPVFCGRYLGSVVPGVKRACLSLVRKMVHYCPASLLISLSEPQAAAALTQLVASVLDNEVMIIVYLFSKKKRKRSWDTFCDFS